MRDTYQSSKKSPTPMALITSTIGAMGAPTPQGEKRLRSSIGLWQSLTDWWGVARSVQEPTEKSVHSQHYAAARAKNLAIELSLFRSIFSPNVHFESDSFGQTPSGQAPSGHAPGHAPSSHACITARFIDTPVPSEVAGSCYIHELELRNSSDPARPEKHIVVIHGYMAAMGYFAKNLEAVATAYPNTTVHVIDLPGFGNSARPTFPKQLLRLPKHASKADEIQQVIDAESWFIDKIEAWRRARNIARFDLMAHSMGAYLSSCYLLKYNNDPGKRRVQKLVLVSPMGTESSDVSLLNNKRLQFNHHDVSSNPLHEVFAAADFDDLSEPQEDLARLWEKLGQPKFPKNGFLRTLWNNHVSPFQFFQYLGPLYSKILSFWSFQRFQNLSSNGEGQPDNNTDLILLLHAYSFSIFNQYQASGELAITKFINHEIVPRLPLCDRGFVEYLKEAEILTLWMYGDKDWMNNRGGEYCVEKLQGLGASAQLEIVQGAGHHIYLDNPETFNDTVVEFLVPESVDQGPSSG